ncbi:hypothetical protein RQP46_001771 [Phenoliferia psychrophenolica]
MLREPRLAFEHRPELLTAIDILLLVSDRYPCSESASKLLFRLSRKLDYDSGGAGGGDAGSVRIVARKVSPTTSPSTSTTPPTVAKQLTEASPGVSTLDWLVRAAEGQQADYAADAAAQGTSPARGLPNDSSYDAGWGFLDATPSFEIDSEPFQFLNDGFSLSFE